MHLPPDLQTSGVISSSGCSMLNIVGKGSLAINKQIRKCSPAQTVCLHELHTFLAQEELPQIMHSTRNLSSRKATF